MRGMKEAPGSDFAGADVPRPTLMFRDLRGRPGDVPGFADIGIQPAGTTRKPDVSEDAGGMSDLATGLVRVLDDAGDAVGPWAPNLNEDELVRGLRDMLLVRELDRQMLLAQRQGKTSFYVQCTGEEAIACGFRAEMSAGDMSFPTYRQQGLLVTAGYPLVLMIAQVLSNRLDPLRGRQMPVLYSSRSDGFFSISGNLATQFVQAVGWAMASAIRGRQEAAAAWIGEGATAEADFHAGLVFASTYCPPVVLNVVNNQWAISTAENLARGSASSFASRGIGYGIPAIRVDGNDYLAVRAVSSWALERARANLGPTLIEWVTYRVAAHSSSDDPDVYRLKEEANAWPLGDPIERLRTHLSLCFGWTSGKHEDLTTEVQREIHQARSEAEKEGTLLSKSGIPPQEMFNDVYEGVPDHLRRQRDALSY